MASHSAEPALMTRTSPGSEEEDEYEDCYLILDLDCSENRNFTREVKAYSIQCRYRSQDLLSSPAVIHLDGKEMRGDHQDTIGTSLIFEQGKGVFRVFCFESERGDRENQRRETKTRRERERDRGTVKARRR
eukprot:1358057-Amorphochlora_amoeboformis.AAC.2